MGNVQSSGFDPRGIPEELQRVQSAVEPGGVWDSQPQPLLPQHAHLHSAERTPESGLCQQTQSVRQNQTRLPTRFYFLI